MAVNSGINTIQLPRSVVQSNGAGQLTSSNGTNGQILIGATAGIPAWANITSLDSSITVTNGAGTINLEVNSGSPYTPSTVPAFLGVQTSDALMNVSNIWGGGNLYPLGQYSALNEVFDQSNSFYPGNGAGSPATFTAPVTGKYVLNIQGSVVWGITFVNFTLQCSMYFYRNTLPSYPPTYYYYGPTVSSRGNAVNATRGAACYSVNTNLDAGDVVTFFMFGSPGTTKANETWVSGYLISL